MGRDEGETVRDLEAHKAAILPLIARHSGSIINIASDGIVAQFPSAARAVECAVIQRFGLQARMVPPCGSTMILGRAPDDPLVLRESSQAEQQSLDKSRIAYHVCSHRRIEGLFAGARAPGAAILEGRTQSGT
jgi:hypothetical protein